MIGRQSHNPNLDSTGMRRENIASTLVLQDHLRSMLGKSQNANYKPWKNQFAPKNPHSPFGDFPKSHLTKVVKPQKLDQVHESSHAGTTISTKFVRRENFNMIFRNYHFSRKGNWRKIFLSATKKAELSPSCTSLRSQGQESYRCL